MSITPSISIRNSWRVVQSGRMSSWVCTWPYIKQRCLVSVVRVDDGSANQQLAFPLPTRANVVSSLVRLSSNIVCVVRQNVLYCCNIRGSDICDISTGCCLLRCFIELPVYDWESFAGAYLSERARRSIINIGCTTFRHC